MRHDLLRRIGRNLLSLTISGVIDRGITFATFAYIARAVGSEGFGGVTYAQAVASYVISLADLGVPTLLVREIGAHAGLVRVWVNRGLLVRVGLAAAALVLLVPLLPMLGDSVQARVMVAMFAMSALPTALVLNWAFIGLQRMHWVALGEVARGATFLIGVLLFVSQPDSVAFVPVMWYGAATVPAIVLAVRFATEFGVPRAETRGWDALRFIRDAVPIGVSAILIQLYLPFNVILMGESRSATETGQYSAAFRLAALMVGFAAVIGSVLLPVIAQLAPRGDDAVSRFVRRVFGMSALVALPACVGSALYARDIVQLVFGLGYAGAVLPFRVLTLFVLSVYLNLASGYTLLATGHQRQYFQACAVGAVLNAVIAFALIPWLGGAGAALATAIAGIAVFFALARQASTLVHYAALREMLWPVSATVIVVVVLSITHLSFWPALVVGPLLYVAVLGIRHAQVGDRSPIADFLELVLSISGRQPEARPPGGSR